jgi:dTDP-4-dehydrorhamnose reductase
MRIIVTGKSGQVVRSLMQARQHEHDIEVIAIGRPELDLSQPTDIYALLAPLKPDIVVNAAAYTGVDTAEDNSDLAMRVNGVAAGEIATACRRCCVPLIQISTDYVFSGDSKVPYVETDPIGPLGIYGMSKLLGELAVAASTSDYAILRTSWVHGAYDGNFVATMLRLAVTRPEIGVVADQYGAPTYAADIAAAVITVAGNLLMRRDDDMLRGAFHMQSGGKANWFKFAEEIFAQSRLRGGPSAQVRPLTTAEYPTKARRPANSSLDCTRIAEHHGVRLPHWQDGLARCMDERLGKIQDRFIVRG